MLNPRAGYRFQALSMTRSRSARASAHYANYFQIGHNAFEFLIEFGQHGGPIHSRVSITPEYARMFSDLLLESLVRDEERQSCGPRSIEIRNVD